ncbi:hypothetical protein COO60DRAFT_1235274 [Scenedesmus sp. NREL 46B-D3]|nr:hypothetical protein COO60DRAFT_1235274 [Scenedesmus sp. NREL 46B-D3]
MRGSRKRDEDYVFGNGSESDEEPALKRSCTRKQVAAKPRRAPKRPAGLVNLKGLVDEGLMQPGDDVLTVEYKGTLTHASLTHDGRIRWKDLHFDSPSAFSIYLKRLINPARKADDGWKTVKYLGKFLEQYKMELLLRRYGEDGAGSAGSGMDAGPQAPLPPSKRARTSGAATAAAAGSDGQSDVQALRQLKPRGGRSRSGTPAPAATGTAAAITAAAAAGASSGRPPPRPPASSAGGVAAAAAAATAAAFACSPASHAPSSSGAAGGAGGSSSGAAGGGGGGGSAAAGGRNDHTPRPADVGSMAPGQHEFAPREGELAGLEGGEVLPVEAGPKHFLSGVELEAMANGTTTPSSANDAVYTAPGLAAAAALAEAAVADTAAAGTATPSGGAAAAATGRPRRVIRPPERLINSAVLADCDKDDHDMVRCDAYSADPPGSGAAGAQPFRVQVAPLVEVVMDFHAHLDRHEVIGLLAGSWDAAGRLLRVERAFPVREAAGSGAANDGINVEMDPEDQFKVTEVIAELYGLSVVGWYHSHPSFPALPSVIDIDNQLQMQQQVRAAGSSDEPYIAAIVSPYNRRLPGLQSCVTWFRVEGGGRAGAHATGQGVTPMELAVERLLRPSTPESLMRLIPALHTTALRYANKRSAANLAGQWLPPAAVAGAAAAAAGDASVGGSGGEAAVLNTRLGKLLGSMRAWWPHSCGADSCRRFMEALKLMLVEAGVAAGMAAAERQQLLLRREDTDRSSSAGQEQQQHSSSSRISSSSSCSRNSNMTSSSGRSSRRRIISKCSSNSSSRGTPRMGLHSSQLLQQMTM